MRALTTVMAAKILCCPSRCCGLFWRTILPSVNDSVFLEKNLGLVQLHRCLNRDSSSSVERHKSTACMRAWQISKFQETPDLHLAHNVPVPKLQKPDDVLVEVNAASINPLDLWMTKGYGRSIIQTMRQTMGLFFSGNRSLQAQTFPLTLGRDFSGTVVDVGPLAKKFKPGDKVYGTVGPYRPGSHAEYTVTSAGCIGHKPAELTDVEAAALPWIACTTYSALVYSGGVTQGNASQRNVLVIGAGGGLGTFAVQLLKAWNSSVIALTRGAEQTSLVQSLGADEVVDSSNENYLPLLEQLGPYDLVLDAAGNAETAQNCANFLRKNLWSRFVTLTSPVLNNADRYSLLPGAALSAVEYAKNSISSLRQGYQYHWAFYMPNGLFLDGNLRQLIAENRIKPIIQQEFGLQEMYSAYEAMGGSSKGKIVVNMKRETLFDVKGGSMPEHADLHRFESVLRV